MTAILDRADVEHAARTAEVHLGRGMYRPLVIDEWAMLSVLLDPDIHPPTRLPLRHRTAVLAVDAFGHPDIDKAELVLRRLHSAGLIELARIDRGEVSVQLTGSARPAPRSTRRS